MFSRVHLELQNPQPTQKGLGGRILAVKFYPTRIFGLPDNGFGAALWGKGQHFQNIFAAIGLNVYSSRGLLAPGEAIVSIRNHELNFVELFTEARLRFSYMKRQILLNVRLIPQKKDPLKRENIFEVDRRVSPQCLGNALVVFGVERR